MIDLDPITGGYVTTYQRLRDLMLLARHIAQVQAYPASAERDEVIRALELVRRQRRVKEGTVSWDVCIRDAATGKTLQVESHSEGGMYVVGGTTDAELNVTGNYSRHIAEALGIEFAKALNGKRAGDVVPLLDEAVAKLSTRKDQDYWAATPGNAGYALSILLRWAKAAPDGVFEVS